PPQVAVGEEPEEVAGGRTADQVRVEMRRLPSASLVAMTRGAVTCEQLAPRPRGIGVSLIGIALHVRLRGHAPPGLPLGGGGGRRPRENVEQPDPQARSGSAHHRPPPKTRRTPRPNPSNS